MGSFVVAQSTIRISINFNKKLKVHFAMLHSAVPERIHNTMRLQTRMQCLNYAE